ncbi:MAG: RNA polymerase sigma factor [Chitinophagaceae bacterium]|nr:RNA polymerase sigma factor [Chitinophagaceae bacterium]
MEQVTQQLNYLPDTQLVDGILSGDKNLFEIIIRRYNQRLFRIGMSVLNNIMEAEDAMQNAYIKAYEHLKTFENRAAFGTWLTRIMLNECLMQKKKNLRMGNKVQQPENIITMATPDNQMMNKELGAALENAIARLPEKYRLVFVLREIEELSVKETGEALNIEEANVKVRLNRAKTMLNNSLSDYLKDNVYSFHLSRCDKMVENIMSLINLKSL